MLASLLTTQAWKIFFFWTRATPNANALWDCGFIWHWNLSLNPSSNPSTLPASKIPAFFLLKERVRVILSTERILHLFSSVSVNYIPTHLMWSRKCFGPFKVQAPNIRPPPQIVSGKVDVNHPSAVINTVCKLPCLLSNNLCEQGERLRVHFARWHVISL